MIDLLTPFKSAFLKFNYVSTDNFAFRLHYRFTTMMLLIFTLLVTSKQFFGEPIHCVSSSNTIDKDAMNSYCWVYGTFTLKNEQKSSRNPVMAFAGIGAETPNTNHQHIKHAYYQWVCFVLLGQAIMFYIPRYLWKMWEGGKMKALAGELQGPLVCKNWQSRREELVEYLRGECRHCHSVYALKFAFCEALNFVNAVGQIFLLDSFLGGAFRNYGVAVSAFTHVPTLPLDDMDFAAVNPMDEYFPKLTKCWFRSFGLSGMVELKESLCVLPLNIINEKIFVILWFWLIILACISGLAIVTRLVSFYFKPARYVKITSRHRRVERRYVRDICDRSSYGDWFVLYLMSKNMNPIMFKDLITELAQDSDEKKNLLYPKLN